MHNKVSGDVSTSLAYDLIVSSLIPPSKVRTHSQLWSSTIPLKIICFVWLCIENQINTWDNLRKKGWSGPNRCSLCKNIKESVNHLFMECSFTRDAINLLHMKFNYSLLWDDVYLLGDIEGWFKRNKTLLYLPLFLIWNLWISRNLCIF